MDDGRTEQAGAAGSIRERDVGTCFGLTKHCHKHDCGADGAFQQLQAVVKSGVYDVFHVRVGCGAQFRPEASARGQGAV